MIVLQFHNSTSEMVLKWNREVEPLRLHAQYSSHNTLSLPLPAKMQVPCLFAHDGMAIPKKVFAHEVCCIQSVRQRLSF